MKKLINILTIAFLFIGISVVTAQVEPKEKLGLPGDNLNLYAVLNLFQNSATLEEFERELNNPEKVINNLDLNNDSKVDYIKVYDYAEKDVHNIVLRVDISKEQEQDVAVVITEKQSDGSVMVQLIGDEMLYGKNYIVEPHYAETPNPAYTGNTEYYAATNNNDNAITTTYYEVAQWPAVVYIYSPSYSPWFSSWYWDYYPNYWHSWTPHYWHYYYGYQHNWYSHYYAYYRPWYGYRSHTYRDYYYGRVRRQSTLVATNVSVNRYKNTYSRPETIDAGRRRSAQNVSNMPKVNAGSASVSRVRERSQADNARQTVRIDRSVKANPASVSRTTRVSSHNNQGTVSGRENISRGSRSESVNRSSSSSSRSQGQTIQRPRNTSQQRSVGSSQSTSGQRNVGVSNNRRSTQSSGSRSSGSSTSVKRPESTTSRPATTTRPTTTSRPAVTTSKPASTSSSRSSSSSNRSSVGRSSSSSSSTGSSRSTTTSNSSGRKR